MNPAFYASAGPSGVSPSINEFLHLDFVGGVYRLVEEVRPLNEILEGYDEALITVDGFDATDASVSATHFARATTETQRVLKTALNQGCTVIVEYDGDDLLSSGTILRWSDTEQTPAIRGVTLARDYDGSTGSYARVSRLHNTYQDTMTGALVEAGRNKIAFNVNVTVADDITAGVSINGSTATPEVQGGSFDMKTVQSVFFFSNNPEFGADALNATILSITILRPIAYGELQDYTMPLDTVDGPPENLEQPTYTGGTEVGDTITITPGTWDQATTIAYKWFRDAVEIAGETATTYTIVSDDIGTELSFTETATNSEGSVTETVTITGPITVGALVKYTSFSTGTGYDLRTSNGKQTLSQHTMYEEAGLVGTAAIASRGYRDGKHYIEFHVHDLNDYPSALMNFVGLVNDEFDLGSISHTAYGWHAETHAVGKMVSWNADTDEAGHAFQSQAGRVFRFEAGHPWRHSHGSRG